MKSDNLIWLDEPSPFFICGECGRNIFKLLVYIDDEYCGDAEIEKGSWFFSFNFLRTKSYEIKLLGFYEKEKAVSIKRYFVID
jgi:hypothetical protein